MPKLTIKLLADCPDYIPVLAELWLQELGMHWVPNANIERAREKFKTHLNSERLPLTFVAIMDEKPVAMVSLRENDGIREDLMPWLGSLVVEPGYRRLGIGERLIEATKTCAKRLGYEKLYLCTFDQSLPNWYMRLGWTVIGVEKLYHHPVTMMEIDV
jgi:GNAT superfamily N-acetyltransferase